MSRYLQTVTPDINQTIAFYTALDFQHKQSGSIHFFGDGNLVIGVNQTRTARAGLAITGESTEDLALALKDFTKIHSTESGLICADPSGVITIINKTEVAIPSFDNKPCALGNSAGLTIESANMDLSFSYYEALGFKTTMGKPSDGWLAMKDASDFGMSLLNIGMCPHLFFNPSVSFFNGKEGNPKIIAGLREKGIAFSEEITHFNEKGEVDNVIVRDPGGLGFFVFND